MKTSVSLCIKCSLITVLYVISGENILCCSEVCWLQKDSSDWQFSQTWIRIRKYN